MAERAKDIVSTDELRSLLHYDPETGIFRWAQAPRRGVSIGSVAGSPDNNGYINIAYRGAKYKAHRLAWLCVNGKLPDSTIDHIDRDPSNNRISNLRLATQAQNNVNRQVDNSFGLRGVAYQKHGKRKKRYVAQISYKCQWTGQHVHKGLGYFMTAEEAHEVYDLAAQMVHGEFYHG